MPIKHAMSLTPEYRAWQAAKNRCYNKNNADYFNYGGRGITMCLPWKQSFTTFYKDLGPRPPGHSLERKDNSKGYSPDNCYWATTQDQVVNRRSVTTLTYKGISNTVKGWSRLTGIGPGTIRKRLSQGFSIEYTLTTPVSTNNYR